MNPQEKLTYKEEADKLRKELHKETTAKRILYAGLKKLAGNLKESREENRFLRSAATNATINPQISPSLTSYQNVNTDNRNSNVSVNTTELNDFITTLNDIPPAPTKWYEGGMFRPPNILPSITTDANLLNDDENNALSVWPRPPVSLTDLFLDLAVVTAFTRVGVAIQLNGTVNASILAYLFVFWTIWGKVTSFTTRFDSTSLTCQVETLLVCLAVLFGSLSTTDGFESGDGTRMMCVGFFAGVIYLIMHVRLYLGYNHSRGNDLASVGGVDAQKVKDYARYIIVMTALEVGTWGWGIAFLPNNSKWRGWVFLVAIAFSLRIGRNKLPSDFYAACSKRGVLFILLLGFTLQKLVMIATPFFDYQMPGLGEYTFMGLACCLLFIIKLLYVDDSFSVDPVDHALLVNHMAATFFHVGQVLLLLSTIILGAGLNLITHSYLAATTALPANAKYLVCGGFSGVIFSIGFIKSLHLRRVPVEPSHRRLFLAAYCTQLVVTVAVVLVTASMCLDKDKDFGDIYLTEIETLGVLCGLGFFTLVIYWMDEAVELSIYDELAEARQFRTVPFGLWGCLKPSAEPELMNVRKSLSESRRHSQSSLFSSSSTSLNGSKMQLYQAIKEENEGGTAITGNNNDDGGGWGLGLGSMIQSIRGSRSSGVGGSSGSMVRSSSAIGGSNYGGVGGDSGRMVRSSSVMERRVTFKPSSSGKHTKTPSSGLIV